MRQLGSRERLYQAILHNTYDAVSIVDLDGRIIYTSESTKNILGYSKDDLAGKSSFEQIHPEDLTDVKKVFQKVIENPNLKTTAQYRRRAKDGTWHWIESTGTNLLHDPAVAGIVINYRDVTERKNLELTLQKSESRFRNIFDNAAVGIIVLSADKKIVKANFKLQKMLGYRSHELENKLITELAHIDDQNLLSNLYDDIILRKQDSQQVERRYIRKDGEVVWVRLTLSSLIDDKDLTQNFMAIVEDITQRKLAEDQIAQQQLKIIACSKMSALGEMAGGIAHEINTPLSVITMRSKQLARLLSHEHPDLVKATEFCSLIEETGKRIAKIIQGLCSFSRTGDEDPFVSTSVESIIDDTLGFCSEKLHINGFKIDLSNIDSSIAIECRAVEISQVLLNLINNAAHALENSQEKWIKIECVDSTDFVELMVIDSGPGIPKQIQDKIFQPFFTTKVVGEGTGLGLSISKGLIENHSGSLVLNTNLPNTCFVIKLPKSHRKAA